MERLAYYTDKSSTSSLIIDKKTKKMSENVISHYLIKDPIRKIRNKNKSHIHYKSVLFRKIMS